jgi:hypothetical protein
MTRVLFKKRHGSVATRFAVRFAGATAVFQRDLLAGDGTQPFFKRHYNFVYYLTLVIQLIRQYAAFVAPDAMPLLLLQVFTLFPVESIAACVTFVTPLSVKNCSR